MFIHLYAWYFLVLKPLCFRAVRPCLRPQSLWTRYFINRLQDFHQIYSYSGTVEAHINWLHFEVKRSKVKITIWPNIVPVEFCYCFTVCVMRADTVYYSSLVYAAAWRMKYDRVCVSLASYSARSQAHHHRRHQLSLANLNSALPFNSRRTWRCSLSWTSSTAGAR